MLQTLLNMSRGHGVRVYAPPLSEGTNMRIKQIFGHHCQAARAAIKVERLFTAVQVFKIAIQWEYSTLFAWDIQCLGMICVRSPAVPCRNRNYLSRLDGVDQMLRWLWKFLDMEVQQDSYLMSLEINTWGLGGSGAPCFG